MVERQRHAPTSIYAIADHLDAVLAATEDLLELGPEPEPSQLLRLELVAITHVLQARQRLQEQQFSDRGLSFQSVQFILGTDAIEAANATHTVVEQSRVSGDYLIGRRISITGLADQTIAMRDALESRYVLYEPENDHAPRGVSADEWSPASAST